MAKQPKIIRPLGHNELYQLAMHSNNFYRGSLVACRYSIPSELQATGAEEKLKDIVDTAIVKVASTHPLLQVGISNINSKKPAWISLDGLDLRHHIEWRHPESEGEHDSSHSLLIASELDVRFENLELTPGWRAIVLHPKSSSELEVVFAYNHANGDGTSGKIFHHDLLYCLREITGRAGESDEKATTQVHQPVSKLPIPTEQLVRLKLSAPFVMDGVWKAYRPSMFNNAPTLARWAPVRTSPYKTNLLNFDVKGDTLDKIISACRKEKTTVTGLCHSVALAAFASRIDAAVAPAFEGGTAVCLRRFLPHRPEANPDRTIANYVSMISHDFDVSIVARIRSQLKRAGGERISPGLKTAIWQAARAVKGDINKRMKGGMKNEQIGLMKFVADWRTELEEKATKPRQLSWTVTNIGMMDNGKPEPEGWALRRAQLGVSAEVPGPAMFIAPMSVAGEQMSVSCTWQDCAMDVRMANGIVSTMERLLTQIVSLES